MSQKDNVEAVIRVYCAPLLHDDLKGLRTQATAGQLGFNVDMNVRNRK